MTMRAGTAEEAGRHSGRRRPEPMGAVTTLPVSSLSLKLSLSVAIDGVRCARSHAIEARRKVAVLSSTRHPVELAEWSTVARLGRRPLLRSRRHVGIPLLSSALFGATFRVRRFLEPSSSLTQSINAERGSGQCLANGPGESARSTSRPWRVCSASAQASDGFHAALDGARYVTNPCQACIPA
jgi:hypothetical protein